MPTPLPIDRPLRLAVVGLGQIAELLLPAYVKNKDIEIVGLCDLNPARLARWKDIVPHARPTTELRDLLPVEADVVDVLVPTPAHADVATAVLEAGFHV